MSEGSRMDPLRASLRFAPEVATCNVPGDPGRSGAAPVPVSGRTRLVWLLGR